MVMSETFAIGLMVHDGWHITLIFDGFTDNTPFHEVQQETVRTKRVQIFHDVCTLQDRLNRFHGVLLFFLYRAKDSQTVPSHHFGKIKNLDNKSLI